MTSHCRCLFLQAFSAPLAMAFSLLLTTSTTALAAPTQNGEEARWLVQSSRWATLSRVQDDGGGATSLVWSVASASESEGRIFLYLMEHAAFDAALTFSEAQVDPGQFFGARCGPEGTLDPQDPRCAKLTITGTVSPCDEDSEPLALDALFASHPQMASWPKDHGFVPCEMKIDEKEGLWLLADFGGGAPMDAAEYHDSQPVHHAAKGFGGGGRSLEAGSSASSAGACYDPLSHECECLPEKCGDALCHDSGGIWTGECPTACECEPSSLKNESRAVDSNGNGGGTPGFGHDGHGGIMHGLDGNHGLGGNHVHGGHHDHADVGFERMTPPLLPRPEFGDDAAGHARWIVAKSLWTTVSTTSSSNEGRPFGNVRSVVDGGCLLDSSGLPYFYVPSPDPTAKDIASDNRVALSFTEAALAERFGDDGIPCGGKDAEDPTCAKLTLVGHAKPLEDDAQVELAKRAFGARHPRARWLARGGAHTGGKYYTLDLTKIVFLQTYGGYTSLSPETYLNWKPDPEKLPGEEQCGTGSRGNLHGDYHVQSHLVSTSKASFSVVLIVLVALFVGSFVGGLTSERARRGCWRSKRGGYTEASSIEENSSEVEEGGRISLA